jgi:hypothetical protein
VHDAIFFFSRLFIHSLQQHKQGSNLPLQHPIQSKRQRLSRGASQEAEMGPGEVLAPPCLLANGKQLLQHLTALSHTELDGQQAVTLVRGTATCGSSGGGSSSSSSTSSWWCGGTIGKAELVGAEVVFPVEHSVHPEHGATADTEEVFADELPWVLPAGEIAKSSSVQDTVFCFAVKAHVQLVIINQAYLITEMLCKHMSL